MLLEPIPLKLGVLEHLKCVLNVSKDKNKVRDRMNETYFTHSALWQN